MADYYIRLLQEDDCELISKAFASQGWQKPEMQYRNYLAEQKAGLRLVLTAFINKTFAGYLTILWHSHYSHFSQNQIPEITDLNVLIIHQKQGIATTLLNRAEALIFADHPVAGIGVGMTKDYGAAQRLYVRRGYIPDGNGLTSHSISMQYGDIVTIDDELVLYFTKEKV